MATTVAFRRFTTPTHRLTVKGISMVGSDVYVTYSQKKSGTTVTFNGDQVEVTEIHDDDGLATEILVYMKQEDTGKLTEDQPTEVQVNWITGDKRNATGIKTIKLGKNLLNRVVT